MSRATANLFIQNLLFYTMRYQILLLFPIIASLFALPSYAVHGGLLIEQTEGPGAGGIAFGLGVTQADPDRVYVDKYVSRDRGDSWEYINFSTSSPMHAIVADPKNADTVYHAIHNVLYKSMDGGKTVSQIAEFGTNFNQPNWDKRSIVSLGIAPNNSNILYAGSTHGHLYKSEDAGASWNELTSKLNIPSPISRIAIHPTNSNIVYVSTGLWYWSSLVSTPKAGNGIFKSMDGGNSFEQIASAEFSSHMVQDVEVSKSNPDIIFITVRDPVESSDTAWHRVYKSIDAGKSWEKTLDSRNLPKGVPFILGLTHVAVDPNNENTVIVSASNGVDAKNTDALFFKSLDGGKTWKKISEPLTEPIEYTHDLEILPNGYVYANVYYRPLMRSFDLGEHWEWASSGINHATIHSLYIDRANRERVFAGTSDGALHTTLDGGQTWERYWMGLHHSTYVSVIQPAPNSSNTLYGGVSGRVDATTGLYSGEPSHETGVYVSVDNGMNWQRLKGLPYPTIDDKDVQLEIYDIFVYPQNPDIILVATSGDGVYRTENNGKTWQEANSGILAERKYWKPSLPAEDLNYCQNRNGNKAYCYSFATHTSMQLIQNPKNPKEIWYLTLNGVFVSRNIGKSWEWLSNDLKGIHTHFMAFDPADSETIYMGTHQGAVDEQGKIIPSSRGLLISRDGGKSWKTLSGFGPGEGQDIRAIAVDPSNPNTVIAATAFPIYISNDKGETWKEIDVSNQALLRQVDLLDIDATAKLIYAGTRTAGVWRGILDYSSSDPAQAGIAGVLAPLEVLPNKEFNISVSIDNLGAQPTEYSVTPKLGSMGLPSQSIYLQARKAAALTFKASLPEPGSYPLSINNQYFGEVRATAPPQETTLPEITTTSTIKIQTEETPSWFSELINFILSLFGLRAAAP